MKMSVFTKSILLLCMMMSSGLTFAASQAQSSGSMSLQIRIESVCGIQTSKSSSKILRYLPFCLGPTRHPKMLIQSQLTPWHSSNQNMLNPSLDNSPVQSQKTKETWIIFT